RCCCSAPAPAGVRRLRACSVGRSPCGEPRCIGGQECCTPYRPTGSSVTTTQIEAAEPCAIYRHWTKRRRLAPTWRALGDPAMRAVVMAGGEGTRLRPMTANQPKPLLPVVNRPIMEHVLRLLKRHGFHETVVTVHFLAALVRNYFGDGEELGMDLQYATEETPRGTPRSVSNAEPDP